MNHIGTKVLETENIILRPFTVEDAQDMYSNYGSDENVIKFLTWPLHTGADVSRALLEDWCKEYSKPDYYNWAIVLKDINEVIGGISVVRANEEIAQAEIGYCIGSKWWHRGYTSQSARAVTEFLIKEVGYNRVCARHAVPNPNSGGVMRKIGMTHEGTLRQGDKCNAGIVDVSIYSILASEI